MNKVKISSSLFTLLKGMLAFDPNQRFSLDAVINCHWFSEMSYKLRTDK